jgi:rhamnosyltransferase
MRPNAGQYEDVCAVIVTYNPPASLHKSIERLREQIINIIVVDNGSGPSSASILEHAERAFSVRLIRNEKNLGIAVALNLGIKHAIAKGFTWIATFDQDSLITSQFFTHLFSAYHNCPFNEKVPLIAPLLCYTEADSTRRPDKTNRGEFSVIRTAMTSGSVIKADVFAKEGFYDESFFMDYVDYDFCLRLWKRGWKLIRANEACLLHRLGTPQVHRVLGLTLTTKSHNPWRRYFIMRNRIILFKRYAFSSPLWCLYDFSWIFVELGKILFFEAKKREQLASTISGIKDGLLWRAQADI